MHMLLKLLKLLESKDLFKAKPCKLVLLEGARNKLARRLHVNKHSKHSKHMQALHV